MDIQEALSVLNPEQHQAVVHEGSSLLILAGAGSGKTRVITTKIAWLINQKQVEPYSILSVTFTKKAANEMRERAVALEERASSAQIRTFHSFGSWFLRKYSEAAGLESSFTVYDDSSMETLVKKAVPSLSPKEAKLAAHQISLAKDYFLLPEDDLSVIGSEFDLNYIYDAYQKRLRATGNADFGDLIMLPAIIMDQNQDIADYIHHRFQVIMVDEYQDSNIAQYKLLQKLSGVEENCGNYVCVVGDDDQSIYKFRGAEVQNILSFPEKFPGTEIIRLETNYRSTEKILNAASLIVEKNENRLGKTLRAARGQGGNPQLVFVDDANQEAMLSADLIKKSVESGGKYSDWALLYRTNAQSLNFEKELLHRKIPYVVVGSLKFYEREEIKDALSYIALCANPKDEISFRRVINKPSRGIGEKTQDTILAAGFVDGSYENLIETTEKCSAGLSKKAREGAQSFVKIYKTLMDNIENGKNLSDFIQRVVTDSGLNDLHKASDDIEGTTRVANLQELANSAVRYECSMQGLLDFLDTINLDRTLELEDEEKTEDAVTLITLHNTKGLEYNKVIITGLEDGVFPRAGKTGAELEEERRLFYVGITRAKDELYVTSAAKRCMYGSWQYMQPSSFLKEVSPAFDINGRVPYGFKQNKSKGQTPSFGKNADQFVNTSYYDDPELAKKWQKGTKVYNDDFGYGVVIKQVITDEDLVINVQFENGAVKKFFPKYQKNKLLVIK